MNGATAIPGVDHSAAGAVYKGLTTVGDRLYATDFHNSRVDVFDASFNPVTRRRSQDPKLPKGYAPFGIQALAGSIFVTYAKQDAAKKDDVAGNGFGYVDQYTPDGQLVARVASGGRKNAPPNAPWGLALAPSSFGVFSGDCCRQLRQRPRERVPGSRRRQVGVQGPAAPRRPDDRRRSTACGRSRSATAPRPGRRRRSTSRPGPAAKRTDCSDRSRPVEV